jgi:hypothetical protein
MISGRSCGFAPRSLVGPGGNLTNWKTGILGTCAASARGGVIPIHPLRAIDSELTAVSDDVMQDEHLGLAYKARVRLAHSRMNIDGKPSNYHPAWPSA